ncbi:MAG: SpoIIE family protein phosphatase [Lysobacteraceae bacterium]
MSSTAAASAPGGGISSDFLPVLAEVSQQLAVSVDLEQTLRESVAFITEHMRAEAAAVFMLSADGSTLQCRACVGPVDIHGLEIPAGAGIVGRTVARRACQLVRDARNDPDFSARVDASTGFVTRSVLCTPLTTAQGVIGAIEIINKRDGGLFDDADRNTLRLLAAPTALALNIARMAGELVEKNRIQRELSMARRLQRSLLPRRRRGAYPVRALNLPAQEISGDFYDFFDLPDGRIAFTLGDVAGKGLDAAFLMVRCASLLRWAGKEGLPPGNWLARANDELREAIPPGMFVCAVAGYYDPARREATWASAGFPPLLRIATDGAVQRLPAEGPPLGILAGMHFPEQRCDLVDAALYLFSDGVTDVRDSSGHTLDIDGVEALLTEHAELPLEARLRHLFRELRTLRVTDDITVLGIEGRPAGEQCVFAHDFPAQPGELATMRHGLGEALSAAGVGTELRQALVLAIDEAASNVIRHAYGGPCERPIRLEVWQDGPALRFDLIDRAPSADPDRLRPRDLDECRPGGLGVNIIDATMDAWQLLPEPGGGNRLRMHKQLRPVVI